MTLKARITAIDRFIKGCKEDGIYDDLNACCVMAGWDSLAGALTPLKGAAPTNANFLDADLDRGIGLKGDGSSKYLDSNRNNNADGQNDNHNAVWVSNADSGSTGAMYLGAGGPGIAGSTNIGSTTDLASADTIFRSRSSSSDILSESASSTGLLALSRSESVAFAYKSGDLSGSKTRTSETPVNANCFVFSRNISGSAALITDATLSFYSIGSATNLALLDARVSTLMADLRAIEEVGFDRDAIAYIRAVEEADGAYLETDVKVAVNNLVSGLKADGLWDAMASTCLLSGPRTLAGALVPLKGDAPTAYGFVDGDYDREGLTGDGTSYLDSNRAVDADEDSSHHISAFVETGSGVLGQYAIGAMSTSSTYTIAGGGMYSRSNTSNAGLTSATLGIVGVSRSSLDNFSWKRSGGATQTSVTAATPASISVSHLVFAYNTDTETPAGFATSTLAFYSIGSSLDLAKLDSHVSAYVTAIGAAV
jgi:hypothetical protein